MNQRFLELYFKRKFNRVNRLLIKFSGFSVFQVLDAFSVSTVFLILIKFSFRLVGENPSFLFNLSFLFFFTFFSTFFDFSQRFRDVVKKIWRKSLPESFYFGLSLENNDNEMKHFIYSQANKKDKFFLNLFFFFIFLRLWIFSEPYLFLFFNFLLTFLLIINKFLVLSSLFSLLLVTTKWTFFLEEKNFQEFKLNFFLLEKIPEGYSLYPSWENAQICALFITRFLHLNMDIILPNKKDRNEYENAITGWGLETIFEKKLRGLDHPMLEKGRFLLYHYDFFSEGEKKPLYEDFENPGMFLYILQKSREMFNEKSPLEKRKLLNEIYKLKKKNHIFFYFFEKKTFLTSMLAVIKAKSGVKQTEVLCQTAQLSQKEATKNLSLVTGKEERKLYDSEKASAHSQAWFVNKSMVVPIIQSHDRGKKAPDLIKKATEENQKYPIKSIVINTKEHTIQDKFLMEEILRIFEPVPKAIIESVERNYLFIESEKRMTTLTEALSKSDLKNMQAIFTPDKLITEHELISVARLIYKDRSASFKDVMLATSALEEYYFKMALHPKMSDFQKRIYLSEAIKQTEKKKLLDSEKSFFRKKDFQKKDFQEEDNPFFQFICLHLVKLTAIIDNENKLHPLIKESRFLSEENNENILVTRRYYSNQVHMPKDPDDD